MIENRYLGRGDIYQEFIEFSQEGFYIIKVFSQTDSVTEKIIIQK